MRLPDGHQPGFGTYKLTGDECTDVVETALDIGYRHIDTARLYENESAVGDAIARSHVPREDIVVASKAWHDELGYDDLVSAARESRDRLHLDSIDRYYVHWPANTYDPEQTFAALEDLVQDGVIDTIAVSNFTAELLDEALEVCSEPIVANQIEIHQGFAQDELRGHCRQHGVEIVACSPFGHGMLLDSDTLQEIAQNHAVSPALVVIAWHLAKGSTPIPKASSWTHAIDNWRARYLALSKSKIARIDAMTQPGRIGDPDFAPW